MALREPAGLCKKVTLHWLLVANRYGNYAYQEISILALPGFCAVVAVPILLNL